MNHYVKEHELHIELDGPLTFENSAKVLEELLQIMKENKSLSVVLDAGRLSYISSAGIRVLLMVKDMAEKSFAIHDVPAEAYDILQMTGVTEMISVRRQIRSLTLGDWLVLGKGQKGTVYRKDAETIVKVFHPDASYSEIEKERETAKKAFVLGVPTALSFDIVKVGDCLGAVYELIDAKSISELLRENPQNVKKYADIFASVLKQLHSIEAAPGTFPSYTGDFQDKCREIEEVLPDDLIPLVREFAKGICDNTHLVHGDYHIGNLLYKDGKPFLIDLESMGMGDSLFDVSTVDFYTRMSDQVENLVFAGIPHETVMDFFAAFMDAYFGSDQKQAQQEALHRGRVLSFIGGIHKALEVRDESFAKPLLERLLLGLRAELSDKSL